MTAPHGAEHAMPIQSVALLRTATGLLQGIVLYLLYRSYEANAWPATEGGLFSSILVVSIFVPAIIVAGVGNLRLRTLALWTLVAIVLYAALGYYDIFRSPIRYPTTTPRIVPDPPLWLALAAMLFITYSMVTAGDADRRFIAPYSRYIEVSWKHGVQLVLTGMFVGIFWALLFLGAQLLELIGLKFLTDLIKRPWFWIPATTLAISYAVHVIDVLPGLISGTRTLKLILLEWLLPLFLPMMTGFAVVFVLALPFTGLTPLWDTRHATPILLTSAAALVFLINAAYQDNAGLTTALIVRLSRWVAALLIAPLVVLAGYGLMLRVRQHGWTPDRVFGFACILVAACYAIGYLYAAARSRFLLREIEISNVITACVSIAVLLTLFSPIADPARISVADQMHRLRSGQVHPATFDYAFCAPALAGTALPRSNAWPPIRTARLHGRLPSMLR